MDKNIRNIYIAFLCLALAVDFTFAQVNSSSSVSTSTQKDGEVEVYLPMQKDDFLLFYGIAENEEINSKISSLRKEFISKVQELKDEYKKDLNEIVAEENLIFPITVTESQKTDKKDIKTQKDNKIINTKNVKAVQSVSEKNTDIISNVKKYSVLDEKEALLAPVLNISNPKTNIYTESSSWFQKVKTLFKW